MKKTAFSTLAIAGVIIVAAPIASAMPQEGEERGQRERGERPPKPDLSEAAETLGITEEDLHAALRASGGPPPNLEKAAESLGVNEEDLKAALPEPPQRGPRRQ